jgi:hypothetical protein
MDGPARLHAAVELSDAAREIRLAGIRARHPDFSPKEAVAWLVAEDHGVDRPRRREPGQPTRRRRRRDLMKDRGYFRSMRDATIGTCPR